MIKDIVLMEKEAEIMDGNEGSLLFVFSFFLFLNLSVLGDILLFILGRLFLVLLVLLFQSVFGGLIGFVPHVADDLGDLSDFGIGVIGFNLVIIFLSEQEKGGKGSFRRSGLN